MFMSGRSDLKRTGMHSDMDLYSCATVKHLLQMDTDKILYISRESAFAIPETSVRSGCTMLNHPALGPTPAVVNSASILRQWANGIAGLCSTRGQPHKRDQCCPPCLGFQGQAASEHEWR